MRDGQETRYAERIGRAIGLIQRRLAEGRAPALADLAAEAALSDYHFHRVFRLMTGETVGAAVQRLRLGRSLPALDKGIAAATADSGYATSQAYARAMRAAADASPSELRDDPTRREAAVARLAAPRADASGRPPPLAITLTSVAPLTLTAVRHVGDYRELNAGFARLFDLLGASAEAVTGLYGIPHDDPRDVAADRCRFDCCVTVADPVDGGDGLATIAWPGGPALIFRHAGDYDLIHDRLDALYAEALRRDAVIGQAPLLIRYDHDPETTPVADLRAGVFLPLAAG